MRAALLAAALLGAACRSEASQPQAEPAAEEDAGIAFHAFLEKFSTRMKASPTKLTAREIFEELDADRDKLVSEQEIRRFRCGSPTALAVPTPSSLVAPAAVALTAGCCRAGTSCRRRP